MPVNRSDVTFFLSFLKSYYNHLLYYKALTTNACSRKWYDRISHMAYHRNQHIKAVVLGLLAWSLSHYTTNYGQLWLIMVSLGALQSTYRGKWGVNRFVWTPRWRFFIGWDVPPTAPAPGTKRCRPCASWRPWGALTGANEISKDLFGLPDEEFFMSWYMPPPTLNTGTKDPKM